MTIVKYTEEEINKKGILPEDVAQSYRMCYTCNKYVSVDDQSDNECDDCSEK